MKTKELKNISIVGLGLLGGSLGLSLERVFSQVKRVGYSHRAVTRKKALMTGAIDQVYASASEAVKEAQLVVLASPLGTFSELMQEMAETLPEGCIVTDVGSTKVLPVGWARKYLPKRVEFLGSHPMAGSEQRGVEFARADLFEGANCIITPTSRTKKETISFLSSFWQALGMRVSRMNPSRHDQVLARISHLPHVLAVSLINSSDPDQILLCGKGFLDTTRIASGPPGLWCDILAGNADKTSMAIERVVKELKRVQKALQNGNDKALCKILNDAQSKRNNLIEKKLKRKELPT